MSFGFLKPRAANAKAPFFFSSRRRHTRWTGDWSSDVCSSDLDTTVVSKISRNGFTGTKPPTTRRLLNRCDQNSLRRAAELLKPARLPPNQRPGQFEADARGRHA